MAICSVLFYISVLFFSRQQSEIVRVSGEKPAPPDAQFEHVHSLDSLVPAPTCQSTLPPGIGPDYGVPLIPSHGPCSPIPRDRDPSRGYSTGDSAASRNTLKKPARGRGGDLVRVRIRGDLYNYQYLVPVSIGSPRQNLNLIMDTGSNVTWTQCMPCITHDCNYHDQQNPYFNTTKSSTFSQLCPELKSQDCLYSISYLDDSQSSGYNALDTLCVGSSHLLNFTFGCGQNSHGDFSKADGILGLAMDGDNNTFLSQTAPTFGKTFCFCIPPPQSSRGYLLLGDGALRHCKVEASTPLIGNMDYDVDLHGITFNHETIHLANSDPSSTFRTLIDSGTTVTRLPRQVYNAVRSKFQEYMSMYPKAPSQDKILRTCYYSKHYEQVAPPKIVLHFNQADVPLDPAGLVLPAENDSVVCFAFYKKKQADKMNIIGSTQMRNLDVLFDVNAGKVGFGRGSCGS